MKLRGQIFIWGIIGELTGATLLAPPILAADSCEALVSKELTALNLGTFDTPRIPRAESSDSSAEFTRKRNEIMSHRAPTKPKSAQSASTVRNHVEVDSAEQSLEKRYRMDGVKADLIRNSELSYDHTVMFLLEGRVPVEALYQGRRMVGYQVRDKGITYTVLLSKDCRVERAIRLERKGDSTSYNYANPQTCEKLPEVEALVLERYGAKKADEPFVATQAAAQEAARQTVLTAGGGYSAAYEAECGVAGGKVVNNYCTCPNGRMLIKPYWCSSKTEAYRKKEADAQQSKQLTVPGTDEEFSQLKTMCGHFTKAEWAQLSNASPRPPAKPMPVRQATPRRTR